MSEPFLAEIRMFGFTFAPRGWALCDGQILPINQNQSLFSLLGTTYGGDGRTTFALPDLRGRVPLHFGSQHPLGDKDGQDRVSLTAAEIPAHTHGARATSAESDATSGAGRLLAATDEGRVTTVPYGPGSNLSPMLPGSVANAGSSAGHENMQPFLVLNFAIAVQGLFPSRN